MKSTPSTPSSPNRSPVKSTVRPNDKIAQKLNTNQQNRQKVISDARFSVPGVRLLGLRNAMSDERIIQVVRLLIQRLDQKAPIELDVFVNLIDRFCDADSSPLRKKTILNFFQDASYCDDDVCSMIYEARFIETMTGFLDSFSDYSPAIATVIANLSLENDFYRDCALHHGAFDAIRNCLLESGDASHFEDIDIDEKDEETIRRVSTFVWAMCSMLNYESMPPNIRLSKSFMSIAQDIINYGDWQYSDILSNAIDGIRLLYESDSNFVRNEIRDVTLSQLCDIFHRHANCHVRESALNTLARVTKVYLCETVVEKFETLLPSILHFTQQKRTCSSSWRLFRNVCCELENSDIPWDDVQRNFVWTLENGSVFAVRQALKALRENYKQLMPVIGEVLSSNWLEEILEVLIDMESPELSTFVTPHGVSIQFREQTWFIPKKANNCRVIS